MTPGGPRGGPPPPGSDRIHFRRLKSSDLEPSEDRFRVCLRDFPWSSGLSVVYFIPSTASIRRVVRCHRVGPGLRSWGAAAPPHGPFSQYTPPGPTANEGVRVVQPRASDPRGSQNHSFPRISAPSEQNHRERQSTDPPSRAREANQTPPFPPSGPWGPDRGRLGFLLVSRAGVEFF
jgi:hypothetical protein